MSSYDYIMACDNAIARTLISKMAFAKAMDLAMYLYRKRNIFFTREQVDIRANILEERFLRKYNLKQN